MKKFIFVVLLSVFLIGIGGAKVADLESPVFLTDPPTHALDGYLYLYGAKAVDPNNDLIVWRLEDAPSGAYLYNDFYPPGSGPVVVWRPYNAAPGKYKFCLVADDGKWHETEQKWRVTVE